MKNVAILRSASGAGKSTVAEKLFPNAKIICADFFFTHEDGTYHFDANLIGRAHLNCRNRFDWALKDDSIDTIVICNTNTKSSDFSYYEDKAKELGHMIFSLVVENRHGGVDVHSVPEITLQRQEQNIRNSLKLR